MKEYDYVLAIDPSGAFNEGLGTTGWVLGNKFGRIVDRGFITAKNFHCPEAFWQAHNILVASMADHYQEKLVVVIEDYFIYADKAMAQVNSRMETCRLIGVLQVFCWEAGIPVAFQRAADVKGRWSNEVLVENKTIVSHETFYTLCQDDKRINKHELDAYRHMIHFVTFKLSASSKPKPTKEKLKSFYNYQDRAWEGDRK